MLHVTSAKGIHRESEEVYQSKVKKNVIILFYSLQPLGGIASVCI